MTPPNPISTNDIVPVMSLSDPAGGIFMLEDVFGFHREEGGSEDTHRRWKLLHE